MPVADPPTLANHYTLVGGISGLEVGARDDERASSLFISEIGIRLYLRSSMVPLR
jgi:hypothetical protein